MVPNHTYAPGFARLMPDYIPKWQKLLFGFGAFLKNDSSLVNKLSWLGVGGLAHSIGALSAARVLPTYW